MSWLVIICSGCCVGGIAGFLWQCLTVNTCLKEGRWKGKQTMLDLGGRIFCWKDHLSKYVDHLNIVTSGQHSAHFHMWAVHSVQNQTHGHTEIQIARPRHAAITQFAGGQFMQFFCSVAVFSAHAKTPTVWIKVSKYRCSRKTRISLYLSSFSLK